MACATTGRRIFSAELSSDDRAIRSLRGRDGRCLLPLVPVMVSSRSPPTAS